MRNTYIEGLNYQLPHPFRADANRLAEQFANTIKIDGVIRWKSNGQVPPQDVLDFWKFIGKKFNMSKSIAAREREDKAAIEEYKKRQKPPTAEELYEMRAAFGPGAEIVDVITGRKIKL